MKKSVLSLVAIVVLSASTLTASAQQAMGGSAPHPQAMGGSNPHPQAMGGSNPHPQAMGGSNPHPQSTVGTIYSTFLAYFGF